MYLHDRVTYPISAQVSTTREETYQVSIAWHDVRYACTYINIRVGKTLYFVQILFDDRVHSSNTKM